MYKIILFFLFTTIWNTIIVAVRVYQLWNIVNLIFAHNWIGLTVNYISSLLKSKNIILVYFSFTEQLLRVIFKSSSVAIFTSFGSIRGLSLRPPSSNYQPSYTPCCWIVWTFNIEGKGFACRGWAFDLWLSAIHMIWRFVNELIDVC